MMLMLVWVTGRIGYQVPTHTLVTIVPGRIMYVSGTYHAGSNT